MFRFLAVLTLSVAVLCSCKSNRAVISGTFTGNNDCAVYLERTTTQSKQVVDSVRTDKKGCFKFKVKVDKGNPAFFAILCKNSRIPLLVSAGERINVKSMCNLARNYTVTGSEGSELLMDFNRTYSRSVFRLDSISNLFTRADESSRKKELTSEYTKEYYAFKREHVKFIVSNATSMAAIYALYQRLPNDNTLFDGSNDLIYYRLVADSLSNYYASSPHVQLLVKEVEQAENIAAVSQMIQDKEGATAAGFPDISMNDIYGKRHTLSGLRDKVVLVDFTTSKEPRFKMLNAELKETYNTYSVLGFEVFQVSLENSKPEWVLAVQEQKVPWINVSDLKGAQSKAAAAYNISAVPSNFLISRDGTIIGKNLYGDNLDRKLAQLLNN